MSGPSRHGGGGAPANDNGTAPPGGGEPRGTAPAARPCSVCGKPATPETRPFCSKRCADVDLHRWLGGRYRIPVAEDDNPPDDEGSER